MNNTKYIDWSEVGVLLIHVSYDHYVIMFCWLWNSWEYGRWKEMFLSCNPACFVLCSTNLSHYWNHLFFSHFTSFSTSTGLWILLTCFFFFLNFLCRHMMVWSLENILVTRILMYGKFMNPMIIFEYLFWSILYYVWISSYRLILYGQKSSIIYVLLLRMKMWSCLHHVLYVILKLVSSSLFLSLVPTKRKYKERGNEMWHAVGRSCIFQTNLDVQAGRLEWPRCFNCVTATL